VFFERPAGNGKPASAGWYNSAAYEAAAEKAGLWAKSLNGDAFSDEMKARTIEVIKEELGQVDCVIYSLASPRRTDPDTGETFKSVLKPIGEPFTANNLDTDKKVISPVSIDPASPEEITATVKVMGGEDWARWIDQLSAAGVLAANATTVAYDYIGPEVTWRIYNEGTIGTAKKHLRATAAELNSRLAATGGRALISVNKAVVTQASSAIPVVPLYISLLFKEMKARGIHEDCIEQIDRLFRTRLYGPALETDEHNRVRMDDWEMKPEVQEAVMAAWNGVTSDNLETETDFAGYQENFLRLFGFGLDGVDYEAEVEEVRPLKA